MSLKRPTVDYAGRIVLYVGLAIGGSVIIGVVILLIGHHEVPPVGWFGLVPFTALVFWTAVKPFRRLWKRNSFWIVVSGLLTLHLAVFSAVLLRYPQMPLFWFVPTSVAEIGLLVTGLGRLFDGDRSRRA